MFKNFLFGLQKRRPDWFDCIGKIFSVLSVMTTILSILSFCGIHFRDTEDKEVETIFFKLVSLLGKHRGACVISALVFVMLVFLTLAIKYRSLSTYRMNETPNALHLIMEKTEEFWEKRDILLGDRKRDISYCKESADCKVVSKYRRELIIRYLTDYTIDYLKAVCDYMSSFVGYDVSACVKLVVEGEYFAKLFGVKIADPKKSYVITLARNSTINKDRGERGFNPVAIDENSDFEEIMGASPDSQGAFFYVSELEWYKKHIEKITNGQKTYKNSSKDWQKNYKGTVVVPIGYRGGSRDKMEFKVVGFLCVDSLSDKAFEEKQRYINVRSMQSFAGLYCRVMRTAMNDLTEYYNGGKDDEGIRENEA